MNEYTSSDSQIDSLLEKLHVPLSSKDIRQNPQSIQVGMPQILQQFQQNPPGFMEDLHLLLSFCSDLHLRKGERENLPFASTYELPLQQKVYFYLHRRGESQAEILENTTKFLVIGYPGRSYPYREFRIKGKDAQLAIVQKDELYKFHTKVLREDRSLHVPRIFLRHTKDIQVVRRRKSPRTLVDLSVVCEFLAEQEDLFREAGPLMSIEGRMKNISTGGMHVMVPCSEVPSLFVRVHTTGATEPLLSMEGRIRRQFQDDGRELSLHIQSLSSGHYFQNWVFLLQLGIFSQTDQSALS